MSKKQKFFSFFLLLFSILCGLQLATEIFALKKNFHPNLGPNFVKIYFPWDILKWSYKWGSYFFIDLFYAFILGLLCPFITLFGLTIYIRKKKPQSQISKFIHGSARFATRQDIEMANLLPPKKNFFVKLFCKNQLEREGVYVGAWEDEKGKLHYLQHNGPEHVLTYAPTRSGKGVGLVIPTLLSWKESCVVTDLKGELWQLTSGWRQQQAKNKVLRFEPADPQGSACWNPLEEIRLNTENEVADVQNLANIIVDPDGKGLITHWQKTAFSLLTGVIIYALYDAHFKSKRLTLADIDGILSKHEGINNLWKQMKCCSYPETYKNVSIVKMTAQDMLDRPIEESGSILSTAKSYLSLYRDPIIAQNISKSDFCINDLMHYDNPISIYLVTQPNDIDRLRPLVRIFINTLIRLSTDKTHIEKNGYVRSYNNRLLLMLDEFPTLGKLDLFQRALGFIAGYGIKCYLICQDINQLKSQSIGYGSDESITSNCHIQNAYPPNRLETAEHLSRLTGQTTVIKQQETISGNRFGFFLGKVSRSLQEVQRPLLTPDECLRMKGPKKDEFGKIEKAGDMIIYAAGYPAIYGKQLLYFKDPKFLKRSKIPPPDINDQLDRLEHENLKIVL